MKRGSWLGFVLAAATLAACVTEETTEVAGLPDRAQFVDGGVSAFMEARCGGLDCHGQVGRPLRIYSKNGLRLEVPEAGFRDVRDTTRAERERNYEAVIGLEPDALADCVRTRGAYVDFQLLLKPLGEDGRGIRHKGGPVLRATTNDPGWNCLYGWASGPDLFEPDQCRAATF